MAQVPSLAWELPNPLGAAKKKKISPWFWCRWTKNTLRATSCFVTFRFTKISANTWVFSICTQAIQQHGHSVPWPPISVIDIVPLSPSLCCENVSGAFKYIFLHRLARYEVSWVDGGRQTWQEEGVLLPVSCALAPPAPAELPASLAVTCCSYWLPQHTVGSSCPWHHPWVVLQQSVSSEIPTLWRGNTLGGGTCSASSRGWLSYRLPWLSTAATSLPRSGYQLCRERAYHGIMGNDYYLLFFYCHAVYLLFLYSFRIPLTSHQPISYHSKFLFPLIFFFFFLRPHLWHKGVSGLGVE